MLTDTKLFGVKIEDKLQGGCQAEHAKVLKCSGLIKHLKKLLPSSDF